MFWSNVSSIEAVWRSGLWIRCWKKNNTLWGLFGVMGGRETKFVGESRGEARGRGERLGVCVGAMRWRIWTKSDDVSHR